jgi:hypothetical protein
MRSASIRDDGIAWPLCFKELANLLRVHRLHATDSSTRALLGLEDCYQIATTPALPGRLIRALEPNQRWAILGSNQ